MTTEMVLPAVTPQFADAVYRLAMQVGWRNAAKRIAFGATVGAVASVSPNGNGHKRANGQKNGHSVGIDGSVPLWMRPDVFPAGLKLSRNGKGGYICKARGYDPLKLASWQNRDAREQRMEKIWREPDKTGPIIGTGPDLPAHAYKVGYNSAGFCPQCHGGVHYGHPDCDWGKSLQSIKCQNW